MFNSYDLSRFGNELKKLRNRSKVTQKMVSDATCIHIDTLRRIENGLCIPKYETIEMLSKYFKTDLFMLLNQTRGDYTLNSFYDEIDQMIVHYKLEQLESITQRLELLLAQNDISTKLIDKDEIILLQSFVKALSIFYNNSRELLPVSNTALLITLFGKDTPIEAALLEDMNFSYLESRILLLLALTKMRLKDYKQSLIILQFLLDYLYENALHSRHTEKLLLKIYMNISYCFHYLNDNENAKKYADEGIQFALRQDSSYCLFYLFLRKGIAEFRLGDDTYHDSFKKGALLLKINNDPLLFEKYQCIILKKYEIDLNEYLT